MRAGLRAQYDVVAGADYYTLLGVAVDHGPEELKKAYKRMSKVRERARERGTVREGSKGAMDGERVLSASRIRALDGRARSAPLTRMGQVKPIRGIWP